MPKFVYYIAYLKKDNSPIIPLFDKTFAAAMLYKELLNNTILSYKLKRDMNVLIHSYADRSAQSLIKSIINNISKIKTKKEIIKDSLLDELKECNNVISLSFDNNELFFEEKISFIAKEIKGIVIDNKFNSYFPSDKSLKRLLMINGTSAFKHYNPIIDYKQKNKAVIITKEDRLRWKKNTSFIIDEEMKIDSSYDFEILNSNTAVTSKDDIWNELVISHIVGYLSYAKLNGIDVKKEYEDYNKIYDLKLMLNNHASKHLIDSILNDNISEEDLIFCQNYSEISLLLLWTLSLTKYPSIKKKCDILKQSGVFKSKEKSDKLLSLAHIRNKNELLDMFDLTSRLYKVEELKKGFNNEIISFHLSAFIFALNYDY